jgi:hypothetical protein
MESLFEQFKKHIDAVDLGQVAVEAIEKYKDIMREKVPNAESPVKGGEWVSSLSRNYEEIKSREGFEGMADLDYGNKRYDTMFRQVNKGANSAEFNYDTTYRNIAMKHQTGRYDRGRIAVRELIPQTKEQLPDKVLEAVKQSFLAKI